jgi:GntR family transcriptional regulator, frlABCD operon transcriptional regulator
MKLNNSSSRPLYSQLMQNILNAIETGVYNPGEKLPNEADLCEIYGVSRITVRRAIQELAEEGYLERKQGKGTFITRTKLARELISVDGFTDFSMKIGKNPSKRILACDEIAATPSIAESLQLEVGSPVLKLERIMFIDNEPFLIDVAHYSLERFPNLTFRIHEYPSSYDALKFIYEVDPKKGSSKKTLTVTSATSKDAEYLKCDVGDTLYNIDKTVYDTNLKPIHISNFKVPTTLVAFTITTEQE